MNYVLQRNVTEYSQVTSAEPRRAVLWEIAMFSKLFSSLGFRKMKEVPPPMPAPEPPSKKKSSIFRGWDSERTVTEGDPACSHQLREVDWDTSRFGPKIADRDPDNGQRIAFTSGNFQYLYRCNCGREVIRKIWGLI